MTITDTEQRTAAPMRWALDGDGTSVDFAVKTFWGLSTVHGRFDHFDGSYEVGPDGTKKIQLTIDADSLETGNGMRDKHLRSVDFFDVAEHPQVRFTSSQVVDVGDGKLHVTGELEAAGTSVPLALDATMQQVDHGLQVEATTTVDQRQLGMTSGLLGMIRPSATLHVKARLRGSGRMRVYWRPAVDLMEVLALARDGRIKPHVERFQLERAHEAYKRMRAGTLDDRAVIVP